MPPYHPSPYGFFPRLETSLRTQRGCQTTTVGDVEECNSFSGDSGIPAAVDYYIAASPSALFEPGERNGKFRVGEETLLSDAVGKNWISMEDYAIAMFDEIEKPAHSRQRYTVGY